MSVHVTASVFSNNTSQNVGGIVCLSPLGGNQLSVKNSTGSYTKNVNSSDDLLDERLLRPPAASSSSSSTNSVTDVISFQREQLPI